MARHLIALLLLFLNLGLLTVLANVEKTIFLGPVALQIPSEQPTIQDLHLQSISPLNSTLRTLLPAEFPSKSSPEGVTTWVLLEGLTKGRRYEVRICWAATQSTSFQLDTYELPEVFSSPVLISSLAEYAELQLPKEVINEYIPGISQAFKKPGHDLDDMQSILLLRIQAAADYYTMNRTLMEQVPPVLVDIILDPFIINVLPRSLKATAVYLVILSVGSWILAGYIASWLQRSVMADEDKSKKKN